MSIGLFKKPVFRIEGDKGLLVEYGDEINPKVNHKVRAIKYALTENPLKGVEELIPTYRSLIIIYNPSQTNPTALKERLLVLENKIIDVKIPPPKIIKIPVCYGGDLGPDIGFVAKYHNITVDKVIELHTRPEYQIYMLGFTPGFPFLGGLPDELHTPRLETPRSKVPAGSVGIANGQTGIYSIDSPGGWQLIGRTPLKIFEQTRENPFLFEAGDKLKFESISLEKYKKIKEVNDERDS